MSMNKHSVVLLQTVVEEKQGISQLELVVEEISEAEKAKEQRRENKRLKRKKRKENKAKLNEELKNTEEEEEEKRAKKCGAEGEVNTLDIDDCSSEKSSSEGSQVSPGKFDQRSASPPSPAKLSPCSSLSDTSFQGLLKPVDECMESEETAEEKPAPCPVTQTTPTKCNTGNSCSSQSPSKNSSTNSVCPTKKTPTKLKASGDSDTSSCKECDNEANGSPPWLEANSRKGGSANNGGGDCSNRSQHHKTGNGTTKNAAKDCECEGGSTVNGKGSKHRNGLYQDRGGNNGNGSGGVYKFGHYNNSNKRNGYNDCRTSQSVGPRFSRYNESQQQQHRLKNEQQQQHSEQCGTTDDFCSRGGGTGKGTAGKRQVKSTNNLKVLNSSHFFCFICCCFILIMGCINKHNSH